MKRIAAFVMVATPWTIPVYAGGNAMTNDQNCVREYPFANREAPPWDVEKVENIWGEPLRDDLILVGGVDSYGWARVCRVAGKDGDVFEGEYRDQMTWYRGRFRLETQEGELVPAEALKTFYASHFTYPEGLILYPIAESPPPVRTLRLTPIDATGYSVPPIR